jgi:WD40 repeat protein/serine/threonine protein kinase
MATGRDSTRVVDLFSEALERPAPERDSFLDAACAGDQHLKTRVHRLLSGADFMDRPAAELERRTAEDAPGQRVGVYELVRPLASGGMGAVWLARRADESFDAVAAIKLIKRGMDTDEILARFRAERQVLATLRHPHIAALLDGGATPDGRPYLVMEYVDGVPIDQFCRERRLGVAERIMLFVSVCAAVEHAHKSTVVHRDLKPANILVTAEGTAKLLDFGIAKVLTRDARATVTHHRILTPGYASPEQVRGEPITTATDVYSLGVVLYELLTGRRPYSVDTDSPAALERAVCETEPARPSTAVLGGAAPDTALPDSRLLRRQLAGDLDTIVLMALRKEPQRRYGSVAQLAEDLRRHLAGLPVAARPDTIRYRAGKFVRRNKVLVGAGTLILASLVGGLAASTAMYIKARRAGEAEVVQRQRASAEARDALEQRAMAEWRAYSAQISAAMGALRAGDVTGARRSLDQTTPELRGWEYRYAVGQLDGSVASWVAHGDFIFGLSLSPDASILATGSQDGLVRLWDRPTMAFRGTIPYFNASVGNIAFSPDGSLLAIPSGEHDVMLWEVGGEREAQLLAGHKNSARAVAFSPDGAHLITGGTDRLAILWDRDADGQYRRHAVLTHPDQVRGVAYSPDGSLVATACFDGAARLWDAQSGADRGILSGHTGALYTAAFSPDGAQVATTSMDRTVRLWSVRGGGPAKILRGHTERIVNAVFSPDGRLVASASWDRSVRLWDANTGECITTLLGHADNVFGLAFTPDSAQLYTAGIDGTVRLWDVPRVWDSRPGSDTRRVTGLTVTPRCIAMSLGADADHPGLVQLWDRQTQRPAAAILESKGGVNCLAADRGGAILAAGLGDHSVAVLDAAGAAPPRHIAGVPGPVRAIAVSPDGELLAASDNRATIAAWESRTGSPRWTAPAAARSLLWTDQGLVCGGEDGTIRVLARTGEETGRASFGGEITSLALSPDGQMLAAGCGRSESIVRLIAWPALTVIAELPGHTHLIQALAFSPDGARLASGSMDHTIKIWDTRRRLEAATLYGNDYGIFSLGWDGDTLLTGAADARVRIWAARPQ